MKNVTLLSVILLSIITNTIYAKPPENIACAKRAVIAYYNSGEYEKDVDLVVQDAERYLKKRIEENAHTASPKKLALILDIDETSLSNFEDHKKRDFSGLQNLIDESYREAKADPIKPVLRLYNEAIKNGVSVFFITFRPGTVRSYTITNLQNAGFYGWSELYLPNEDEAKSPAQAYKTAVREALTKKGFDIILNLGDQDSDLNGGYAEHIDKIPNPLYTSSPNCDKKSC